ncbi:hypothetical protein XFF6992_190118 [Xanthomonas citri pv. fuscans]|nr:hypothetical protein XFF6992_190118 [Xanthomonas citri pv. fuscans]SOO30800.1 hypothetical protein XFF6994_1160007 [Xanthomonas citri pv. fuscans]
MLLWLMLAHVVLLIIIRAPN